MINLNAWSYIDTPQTVLDWLKEGVSIPFHTIPSNFEKSTTSNDIKTENDSKPQTRINDDGISTTEKVKPVTNLNTKTTNNDFPLWTWWTPSKSNNTSEDNADTPNSDAATDSPLSMWENDQTMKNGRPYIFLSFSLVLYSEPQYFLMIFLGFYQY